jgi:hypothetical protein
MWCGLPCCNDNETTLLVIWRGWLGWTDWLADWLVGSLVGCLAGLPVGWVAAYFAAALFWTVEQETTTLHLLETRQTWFEKHWTCIQMRYCTGGFRPPQGGNGRPTFWPQNFSNPETTKEINGKP